MTKCRNLVRWYAIVDRVFLENEVLCGLVDLLQLNNIGVRNGR
jgi:hypothetical protein